MSTAGYLVSHHLICRYVLSHISAVSQAGETQRMLVTCPDAVDVTLLDKVATVSDNGRTGIWWMQAGMGSLHMAGRSSSIS